MSGDEKLILLVEDEAIIALSRKKTLENYGYKVITANTGEIAINLFRDNNAIDLVLMDIDLGKGIDGTETASMLLEEREIPVVFLSSHTEPEIVEKTEKITSYGYVVKNSGITVIDASIKMAFKLFDAKKVIRESEEKFRNLFNNLHVGMFRSRLDGSEVLELNDKFLEILGLVREEIIGKPSQIRWADPYERDEMVKMLKAYGRVENMECRLKKPDGSIINCITSIKLYREQGILEGSIQDITAGKLIEKTLRESEYFFRESQRVANIGSYKTDFIAGYWESSEVLDKIFGIDKSYIRSIQGWLDIVHPGDRDRMDKYLREEVISRRKPFLMEYRIIRKNDGETRWVSGMGEVSFGTDGGILSMIGTIQDITDRKLAEEEFRLKHEELNTAMEELEATNEELIATSEELREKDKTLHESEERFRLLFEHMDSINIMFDVITDKNGKPCEYRYLDVNAAFEKNVGMKCEELIGRSLLEVFPQTEKHMLEKFENVVTTGIPLHFDNYSKILGAYTMLNIYTTQKGKLALTILDISDRKRTEEEHKRNIYELKERNKELNCIYQISEIVRKPDISMEEVLYEVLSVLSQAYQYPEIAACRISLDKTECTTGNFRITGWLQSAVIRIRGEAAGKIEVCYLEERPAESEGPFMAEERKLIDAVAELIGKSTERKQAEEISRQLLINLNNRTAELDAVFNMLPFLLSVHAPDGSYIRVNKAVINTFGFDPTSATREEIAGRLKARFPDGSPLTPDNMPSSRSLRGEYVSNVEYIITDKTGNDVNLQFNGYPLIVGGKFNGAVFAQADITAHKHIEEELKNTLLFQKIMLEAIPSPVFYKDIDRRYLGGNKAFEQFTGMTLEQFIGKTIYEFMPASLAGIYDESDRELLENPGRQVYESRVTYADGSLRDVIFYKSTFTNTDGKIAGLVTLMNDITDRKRAENLVMESEAKYRSYVENAPYGIFVCNEKGLYVEVNEAVSSITGYSRDELLAMSITDLLSAETAVAGISAHRALLKSGKIKMEIEFRRKDGSTGWWSAISAKISGTRYLGFIEDITDVKKLEIFNDINRKILTVLNESGNIPDSIHRILSILKTCTGFDAVGIRLQDGVDFPYFIQEGFSGDFLLTENSLLERNYDGTVCRDAEGNVILECTCGLVLTGKTDPGNAMFTEGGSCWTNDSIQSLEQSPDEDPRHNPRNQCIHHGYASVALIPIRSRDKITGLIQLNDRQKDLFTPGIIKILEGIATHVGEALMRNRADAKIQSLLNEKELLLRESHHRIKNFMNTINGILLLQAVSAKETAVIAALEDTAGRLQRMSVLYDKLFITHELKEVPVKDYIPILIDDIINNFPGSRSVEVVKNIGDFIMDTKRLQPVGIIINELLTNIMKYAFIANEGGLIEISLNLSGNRCTLVISDNGIGIPDSVSFVNSPGFGMQLVNMLMEQMGGDVRIERNPGTKFVLEFNI